MNNVLQIIPIAAAAFIATNLDNFALLVTFLVRYRDRTLIVAGAYFTSIFLLGLVGYAIGSAAATAPVEYLGWLGLMPMAIGTAGVVRLVRAIITFGALFADSNRLSDTLIILTLTAMTIIFFLSARHAIRHPAIEARVEVLARYLTPFILIIVGTYIVANTATDVLPA
jgi:cadmium resistance protein CadD (predicted permease)